MKPTAPRTTPVPIARPVRLRVNIDRLTLPGFSPREVAGVVSSLKQRLTELANNTPGPDWSNPSAIDRVDGGTICPGAKPHQIGAHLAAEIFRRLQP